MNRALVIGIALVSAVLAGGSYARAAGADLTNVIVMVVGMGVMLGIALPSMRWAEGHRARVEHASTQRGVLLTAAFRSIAARLGLEDPWPGRRADELPAADGLPLNAPALRGTLRGHRVNVIVRSDEDGDTGDFQIVVRGQRRRRWILARSLHRKPPPPGLSRPALAALERLQTQRRALGIDVIQVDAYDELTCNLEDRITQRVTLEQARTDTALPEPTELEMIIQELVTIAEGWPAQNSEAARA
jgi:hypothetical protein